MTQILVSITPYHILQVSDRLVSQGVPGGPWSPYDVEANKTIVYLGKDGIGVISYSGQAHIGATPTDQWMVERLAGVTDVEMAGRHGGWAMRLGDLPLWWNLGQAMRHLRDELESVAADPSADLTHPLTVILTGWRSGLRSRADSCCRDTPTTRDRAVRLEMPQPSPAPKLAIFTTPDLTHDGPLHAQHAEAFRSGYHAVTQLFIAAVRDKADATGVVGRDVTTVLIPRPGAGKLESSTTARTMTSN